MDWLAKVSSLMLELCCRSGEGRREVAALGQPIGRPAAVGVLGAAMCSVAAVESSFAIEPFAAEHSPVS